MLAEAHENAYCELVADFQQYYGLDYTAMDVDAEGHVLLRASILAAQLPRDGRVRRKFSPLASVSLTDQLIRQLELDVRQLIYGFSDKASRGEPPEPIYFDGEIEAADARRRREARMSAGIAEKFGMGGLEAVVG